jgi:Tfp pilus assembly protein PilP
MNLHLKSYIPTKIAALGLAVSLLLPLTGCEELNRAVDGLLGGQSPSISSAAQVSPFRVAQTQKQAPRVSPGGPKSAAKQPAAPKPQPPAAKAQPTVAKPQPSAGKPQPPAPEARVAEKTVQPGKKRAPGQLSPVTRAVKKEPETKTIFTADRDPFRQPTEILPSECPPSVPLCRFDRSQLKLVGVIQVNEGQFKGMVEDPDGRGYFVMPGMQIGGATVTQVNSKGITLHLHKTRQDVLIPLFVQPKECEEY